MTRSFRPYIALDLETTGLNREKSEVLQIGAVLDNGGEINSLQCLNVLVHNGPISYGEPMALSMNGWIFAELADNGKSDYNIAKLPEAVKAFEKLVTTGAEEAYKFDEEQGIKHPKRKVEIAGKNPGSFGVPILDNSCKRHGLQFNQKEIHHRFIDPGGLYYADFGRTASLNEINKITGRDKVSHDALQDALDVVYAIRHKLTGGNL